MDVSAFIEHLERIIDIADQLKRVEEKLDRLVEATPVRQIVTASDICTELRVSRDQLRTRPWILPSFGQPDISGRTRKWFIQTWEKWKEDLPAREQAWHSMSDQRRNEILGEPGNRRAYIGSKGMNDE